MTRLQLIKNQDMPGVRILEEIEEGIWKTHAEVWADTWSPLANFAKTSGFNPSYIKKVFGRYIE